MRGRGRALALSGAVTCAGACGPDDPFEIPPIVWSGHHLDFAPQAHATPVCAGTAPYMDRYLDLLAADMGVAIGRSVYVHGSRDDPSPCDDDALACFHDGAVIYSPMAPHEHELVHAARYDVGHPMTFFEEGAAEMFGGDDELGGRRPGRRNLRAEGRVPRGWRQRMDRLPMMGRPSAVLVRRSRNPDPRPLRRSVSELDHRGHDPDGP